MTIVVAGATGFLGRALVAELQRIGHDVVAVSRDAQKASSSLGLPALAWDDPGLPAAAASADAVVNLTGEGVAERRWTPEFKERLRASRIEPARRLAALAPKTLIQASGVGYYGDGGERVLTEADPPGDDFLAQLSVAWEAASGGDRCVLLRIGAVLGRGGGALPGFLDPPMLPFSPFRLGLGGPLGDGHAWFPWVHVADVVGLILLAIDNARVVGPLNAVAPNPVRSGEFAAALGRVLGKPAVLPVPAFALRLLLGEFADALLMSQRALPEKALALGYAFRFPDLDTALRDLLAGQ